jgi:pimeloyl-ACP methyl ester carboxylesterase
MPRSRKRLVTAIVLVAVAVGGWMAAPLISSAAFLLDLGGPPTTLRRILPVRRFAVRTENLDISTRHGVLAARVYEPAVRHGLTLVVFPGVHGGGVDEPRMVKLSSQLAATGARVVAVPLPDLRRYRLTPRSTDMIEDAAAFVAADARLAPEGEVGLVGVSFSGGLALVAAGRPALSGRVRAVVAIGAHADLPRVMRYLCTGVLEDGSIRPPHDYGAAIMLLHSLSKLVSPADVPALDAAIVEFLDASSLADTDPAGAARMVRALEAKAAALPPGSQKLLRAVLTRDVAMLGPLLLPFVEDVGGDAALSPARSPVSRVPAFLLHGAGDDVIPTSENEALAAYLAGGGTPVERLVTPLLTHATIASRRSAGDVWRLLQFWTSMRRALD